MEKLKPKLFSVMKTYTKEQFVKRRCSRYYCSDYSIAPCPLRLHWRLVYILNRVYIQRL